METQQIPVGKCNPEGRNQKEDCRWKSFDITECCKQATSKNILYMWSFNVIQLAHGSKWIFY